MRYPIILSALILLISCGATNKSTVPTRRVVPVAFNIKASNSTDLNLVDMDYYRTQILNKLENYQNIKFILAEADQKPELTINLNIANFTLWPRSEQVNRREFTKTIPTGYNSEGKATYQTIKATADMIGVQRRSHAEFLVNVTFEGSPSKTYQKSLSANYNYMAYYTDNIMGDSRALENGDHWYKRPAATSQAAAEPQPTAFLVILSDKITDRVSRELWSHYRK